MTSISGRHFALGSGCLIITTSFKGYFIIFNGRGFCKIINLIFGVFTAVHGLLSLVAACEGSLHRDAQPLGSLDFSSYSCTP